MAKTLIGRGQLETTDVGASVITKVIQGTNIIISSTGADSGTGDVTINATGGAGLTLTNIEKDLGAVALKTGSFTVTSTGLTTGKPVVVTQAVGPYTGKGSREDECEMDEIRAFGVVTNATTITVYFSTDSFIKGNIKFNYIIGA